MLNFECLILNAQISPFVPLSLCAWSLPNWVGKGGHPIFIPSNIKGRRGGVGTFVTAPPLELHDLTLYNYLFL